MADKIRVTVLRQKVFHDGSSMVVLSPKAKTARVDVRFVADLHKEGFIADPGERALRASAAATGFTDAGEIKGVGDNTLSQPIGAFTEEQERSLAEQSQALGDGDEELDAFLEENKKLRGQVTELSEDNDRLQDRITALERERDELTTQLDEVHVALAAFDPDGNGAAGGSSAPGGGDVPALRQEYEKAIGKKPFPGWNAEELRKRIADHKAGQSSEGDSQQGDADEDDAPAA